MITFDYLEDYIEYMVGHHGGGIFSKNQKIPRNPEPFKLARYDEKPIQNMASQTFFGTALTDKQADLCKRIVLNYRKQFAKRDIDVSPVENPRYRMPLRILDRRRLIYIEDKRIRVQFPYIQKLIDQLREYKESQRPGSVLFGKDNSDDNKFWHLSVTEQNVVWAAGWGRINEFEISDEIQELENQVIDCEEQDYKIELVKNRDGYEITNAATSLVEYIEENLGGFGLNNIITLADAASYLGYEISEDVLKDVPPEVAKFIESREVHIKPHDKFIEELLLYAEITNKWPIYIFDSQDRVGISEQLNNFGFHKASTEIVFYDLYGKPIDARQIEVVKDHSGPAREQPLVKVHYAKRIPKDWSNEDMPIFVNTMNLIHSHAHTKCLTNSERVISYYEQKL